MRLTFVITSLERGGAERTLSALAGALSHEGNEITVVVFDHQPAQSYPLDPGVRLHSLGVTNGFAENLRQAIVRNLRRLVRLRRAIQESNPDIVISFMDYTNVVTLLSSRGLRVPIVITEHANPDYAPLRAPWQALRRWLYPHASMLVCPTAHMAMLLSERFGVPGRSIPNPVGPIPGQSHENITGRTDRVALGMGRLTEEKGFDLLLHAFARVAPRHPDWRLMIVGKGPLREQLEAQARMLGLDGKVTFTGELVDPFAAFRAADLFVFSSRFEGFGNALVEALACGLPAISFDCVAGPSEIIRDGEDGIIVPRDDVAALAKAIDRLMSDPELRAKLGHRGPEVLTRFSLNRVIGLWNAAFEDVRSANRVARKST